MTDTTIRGESTSRFAMLALIGLALILSMTTWFSATAILSELQVSFGLSNAAASWLTNAVQLGFVTGALGLGISGLADVLPLRGLMAASAALAAASNFAVFFAPDAFWLFAARFVTGAALAGIYPPALKLIATWFVRGRGLAMGATVGAQTFGSSTPYLVKAVGARVDWHQVVTASSTAALAGMIVLLVFVREGPYAAARPKLELSRIATVIRDPALSLANLGYFGHMWELFAMWAWFQAYTLDAQQGMIHLTDINAPLLTFLVIATGGLGCVCGGLLADRIGRTATTALMMAISGTCAIAIGFTVTGPSWLFITIALVWGFSVIADSAQFSAMVSELSDHETTGAALAFQIGVGFALTVVSIRLLPYVAGAIGWRWTYLILAPGPFLGTLAMLVLRGRPEAAAIANGRR